MAKDNAVYVASKTQPQETTGGAARVAHHPVFSNFQCWEGTVPKGFFVNFLGVMTRVGYFESYAEIERNYPADRHVETKYPDLDEEYFEWIDLLEAIELAQGSFTMLELGAGYGRWTANAAAALKCSNGLPYHLVAVEAEPTHFQWMTQHLADNAVGLSNCQLVQGAVAPADGKVGFRLGPSEWGGPSQWYGQYIGGPDVVDAVSLNTLLGKLGIVDLIDLDVQGAEFEVLKAGAEQLDEKVKRIHIGTHGSEIEAALHSLFNRLGWECVRSFALGSVCDTEWGKISFQDGVQTWLNPGYSGQSRSDPEILAKKLAASRREGARLWEKTVKLRNEAEEWRVIGPSSAGWRILTKARRLRDRLAPAGSRRRRAIEYLLKGLD